MSNNFPYCVQVDRILAAVAAGTSVQTSAAYDSKGFEEVTFLALFGTLTAGQVTNVEVHHSDAAGSGFVAIANTGSAALADGDSGKIIMVTVHPIKRYLKLVVNRATQNAVIDGVLAFGTGARLQPVTHSADVASFEVHTTEVATGAA